MVHHDYDFQLTRYDEKGWLARFTRPGLTHERNGY